MNQISAADNHIILASDTRWRMSHNERPLVEATSRRFRYGARFAKLRRLPPFGELTEHEIEQVVLGWQQTDEAWHLGLILRAPVAEERGSRWVELVNWPDPDIVVFQDLAQVSGQRLAQVLGIPFYVIPPQRSAEPVVQRDLPDFPLRFGVWEMTRLGSDKRRFIIQRQAQWTRQRLSNIAWYGLWALIYAVISLATLISPIALPNTGTLIPDPQWLPYLGLATAVLLVGRILYQAWLINRETDRIMVDSVTRTISGWKGETQHWSLSAAEIQSVFASEIIKKKDQSPATEYGELNLHLGGGTFHFLLKQAEPETNENTPQPETLEPRSTDIHNLTRNDVHTDLQAAALYIADALGQMAVWHDVRAK